MVKLLTLPTARVRRILVSRYRDRFASQSIVILSQYLSKLYPKGMLLSQT
ncbi:hypothetical protein NWP22_08010 [Anabaenopsis tanganyikae CS-531]|uniref:Uncharacterized protein n=1 Tax=Anabaenopsis tanganyikae CS-531 TaxID=2785304 RepID=A0ABT6KEP6_9CYAN|nr:MULTISPECIES: hypothetical protein [Anabaenopsis]MDH6098676.1 hypothetical protein [Anabaenopsis sp. FSS-46]MDH6105809.1 hypothetical protein [Anabaenopsis tanganyikae CS-531]